MRNHRVSQKMLEGTYCRIELILDDLGGGFKRVGLCSGLDTVRKLDNSIMDILISLIQKEGRRLDQGSSCG